MDKNVDEILQKNEDRINRYLLGEMTKDEEVSFETDLQKDETLKAQAEVIARTIKAMKAVGDKRDKEWMNMLKTSSKKKRLPVRWFSIAASFAIILSAGYYFYDYSATTSLGEEYASIFPTSTIIRGEEDSEVEDTLTILFDNVANGNELDITIAKLEQLWEIAQSDTYNEYTTYAPYIGWNLAIAYLRDNNKKKSKQILIQMKSDYSHETPVREMTDKLLSKI